MGRHEYGKLRDEALIKHLQFIYDLYEQNKTKVSEHVDISVRNLRNLIEDDKVVKAPRHLTYGSELWLLEKQLLEKVHAENDFNTSKTARVTGVCTRSIFNKLREYRMYNARYLGESTDSE